MKNIYIFRQICANKSAPIIEFHRIWQVKNTYSSGASWGDYSQLGSALHISLIVHCIISTFAHGIIGNYLTIPSLNWLVHGFCMLIGIIFFCYKDDCWVIGNCVKFSKICMVFIGHHFYLKHFPPIYSPSEGVLNTCSRICSMWYFCPIKVL